MPELPEVETVCRQVGPKLIGRRARSVVHASPLMVRPPDNRFQRGLESRLLERLDRQGKWMFLRVEGGTTLVLHLGMSGRLEVADAAREVVKHTHLRLSLDDGKEELRFVDPRRFGEIVLYGPDEFEARFGAGRLGPDALSVTAKQLHSRLQATRRNLKTALLDQRVVAGIGNIYADEILHAAGLAPAILGCEIDKPLAERLVRCIRKTLRQAIKANGTTIRSYVTAQGVPGDFQSRLSVYGRDGQPCRKCKTPVLIAREIVSGRATYWCPDCQPLGKPVRD